jgi:glucose-1-phosphate cytidylyltransferase
MMKTPMHQMETVILAGGLGSRISEESRSKPKPLIEIGDKPIIWHIMKTYSHFGVKKFVICLGYKGHLIKDFFANLNFHLSDVQISSSGQVVFLNNNIEDWTVKLIETGQQTQTGGRIRKVLDHLENPEFFLTYGDGLADIDITKLYKFHQETGAFCTVTATRPVARFGALNIEGDEVKMFIEKPLSDGGWINGGFFVINKKIEKYLGADDMPFENFPLKTLAEKRLLKAYKHEGFWQPMDTMREHKILQDLWENGAAPWKIWE